MLGIINLPAFIAAGILLNLTPGADTMYILGRSMSQGRKAGIYSALGISTGVIVHINLAAFGLSLIIAKSTFAFDLIKYAGAFYLAYLGIKMLIKKPVPNELIIGNKASMRGVFLSGVLTNVLNPKVSLFFLVFLPQFVEPANASDPLPFLILGLIVTTSGTIWCLILAVFSSTIFNRIRNNTSS